jgi:hypothetical protein
MRRRCGAWLLAGLVAAGACDKRGLSARLHEEARAAAAEGRVKDAQGALERALRYDPHDAIALERLMALQVASGDFVAASRLLAFVPERSVRTTALENLVLRVRIRADLPQRVVSDAVQLQKAGRLAPEVEAELIAEIAARLRDEAEDGRYLDDPAIPESLVAGVVGRLIEHQAWGRACSLLGARPRSPALEHARRALLEALHRENFQVPRAVLEQATAAPRDALAYLGRLELFLGQGRELEAARLEPPASVLTDALRAEWNERWARHFFRRSDWYGVLGWTEQRAPAAPAEARRHALRTAALLHRLNRAGARAELAAWLRDASAAAEWGKTLLLPELEHEKVALSALRDELERRVR